MMINMPLHLYNLATLPDAVFTLGKFFSKEAYEQQVVEPTEVTKVFQENNLQLSPAQEQAQSIFCQVMPLDIKNRVFQLFSKKDLTNCLTVCKQFYVLATPLLIKSLDLIADFCWLENNINRQLIFVKLPTHSFLGKVSVTSSNPQVGQKDLSDIQAVSRKIASFKAYCLFLAHQTAGNEPKLQDIMYNILKLEKACKSTLEEKTRMNQQHARMQPTISKVNNWFQDNVLNKHQ